MLAALLLTSAVSFFFFLTHTTPTTLLVSLPILYLFIQKVTERVLAALGVATCADVFRERVLLHRLLSARQSAWLLRHSLGLGGAGDARSTAERGAAAAASTAGVGRKSIGAERTFAPTSDGALLDGKLAELAAKCIADMEACAATMPARAAQAKAAATAAAAQRRAGKDRAAAAPPTVAAAAATVATAATAATAVTAATAAATAKKEPKRTRLRARQVTLKLKRADFTLSTRARTLPSATCSAETVLAAARSLLEAARQEAAAAAVVGKGKGKGMGMEKGGHREAPLTLRLIGLRLTNFVDDDGGGGGECGGGGASMLGGGGQLKLCRSNSGRLGAASASSGSSIDASAGIPASSSSSSSSSSLSLAADNRGSGGGGSSGGGDGDGGGSDTRGEEPIPGWMLPSAPPLPPRSHVAQGLTPAAARGGPSGSSTEPATAQEERDDLQEALRLSVAAAADQAWCSPQQLRQQRRQVPAQTASLAAAAASTVAAAPALATYVCPVCNAQLVCPNSTFNGHLDACLNRSAVLEAQRESNSGAAAKPPSPKRRKTKGGARLGQNAHVRITAFLRK